MGGRAIAIALVEGSTWTWELKVDDLGLFRWYFNGRIHTNLRGCSLAQAESELRRFVDNSLRGELKVTYPTERTGPDVGDL
jgi:hypothetical protein